MSSYPWCYFHRHPILVVLVARNYRMRKKGLAPDKWYKRDIELMRSIPKQEREKFL